MKRPTKKKMYQKRRKREKAEQRKVDTHTMLPGKSVNAFRKCRKVTENEYTTNKKNINQQISDFSPITSYSQGLQLWWRTYCSAIEFHSHQQNAWQNDCQENYSMLLQKYANEYETSSEEEEEGEVNQCPDTSEATECTNDKIEEYVDEEYIKFLEITRKHREEMRLERAKDNC